MLTYGKKRPWNSPVGDYKVLCAGCGAAYYRSRLSKERTGLLKCKYCLDVRDEITLGEIIAAAAAARPVAFPPRDGGQSDPDDGV